MLPNSLEYKNILSSEIYKALKSQDSQKAEMAVEVHLNIVKKDILDHSEKLRQDSLVMNNINY